MRNPSFSKAVFILALLGLSVLGFFQMQIARAPIEKVSLASASSALVSITGRDAQPLPSSGSGFLVSTDGIILTSKHVVEDASASYSITLKDGKKFLAESINRDPSVDIAIVKIHSDSAFPFLELSTGRNLEVGQPVISLENDGVIKSGHIEELDVFLEAGKLNLKQDFSGLIRTGIPLDEGGSGGPLLNMDGEVIGMMVARSKSVAGESFALPVTLLAEFFEKIRH